MLNNYYLNAYL